MSAFTLTRLFWSLCELSQSVEKERAERSEVYNNYIRGQKFQFQIKSTQNWVRQLEIGQEFFF